MEALPCVSHGRHGNGSGFLASPGTGETLSLERTFLLVVSVVPWGFLVVFFLTKVLAEQKIASAWLFMKR